MEARIPEVRPELGKDQATPSKDNQVPLGGVQANGLTAAGKVAGKDPANRPAKVLAAKARRTNGATFAV